MVLQAMNMLRVKAIASEPTRFYCESGTLTCVNPQCGANYNRRTRHQLVAGQRQPTDYLCIGDKCPKCGSYLDVRFLLVDIADFNGNGICACEWFQHELKKLLNKELPSEQAIGKHRCQHISAVRDFALDLSLKCHELERYKNANGQREEDQP